MANDSPSYVGDSGTGPNPKLIERIRSADLLLVLGARLGEMTTQGYEIVAPPEPKQALIHVHPAAEELGRVYRPTLAIQAGQAQIAAALAAMAPLDGARWADWTAACRADYEWWVTPNPVPGPLDLGRIFADLRESLPAETIVTTDAGNFSGWGHRFLKYRRPGRQLGPTNGSMGYSVPAAIAASIANPGRLVIGLVGDGGFMMNGQELATAVAAGATPVIFVFDNGIFGTIRMHQEMHYPGRVVATDLVNPDFAALARSYGCFAATVETTEQFWPAFEQARAAGRPALLHLKVDPEVISTRTTLTNLRTNALKAKGQ